MMSLIYHNKYAGREGGNALFLILIAVILFAALSYAITKSSSGNASSISQEKLAIEYAKQQQILTGVATAVQKMEVYGCHADNSYFNWDPLMPPPPETDKNCILYGMHGGSVQMIKLDNGFDGLVVRDNNMPEIGTTRYDTVVWYNFGRDAWLPSYSNPPDTSSAAYKSAEKLCDYINKKNEISYTVDVNEAPLEGSSNWALVALDTGSYEPISIGLQRKKRRLRIEWPECGFHAFLGCNCALN